MLISLGSPVMEQAKKRKKVHHMNVYYTTLYFRRLSLTYQRCLASFPTRTAKFTANHAPKAWPKPGIKPCCAHSTSAFFLARTRVLEKDMATTDDSLLEVLQEIRAMSDKFEELRHDVDILKGRPPTPARSSSRESSSSSSSSSSSESEDSDSEQSSSRSRANLTKHRVPAKSRTSRRHSRSRRRSHSSRSRAGNKRSHSQSGAGKQNKQGASRSQSRPPTKRSKKAASWADRMDAGDEPVDYSAPVTWPPDSDEEDNPKLQEVSEETKKVLETSCLSRKSNQARLQVRSPYPLPKVTASRKVK